VKSAAGTGEAWGESAIRENDAYTERGGRTYRVVVKLDLFKKTHPRKASEGNIGKLCNSRRLKRRVLTRTRSDFGQKGRTNGCKHAAGRKVRENWNGHGQKRNLSAKEKKNEKRCMSGGRDRWVFSWEKVPPPKGWTRGRYIRSQRERGST